MIWSRSDYWLEQAEVEARDLASQVYRMVVRQSFNQPGFAIIAFPASLSSRSLREVMLRLKQELSRLFCEQWHEPLEYLSLGRFDQQTTTKLHLDGAPDRSILMLGYEPTEVVSEFIIADYSACAHPHGINSRGFPVTAQPDVHSGTRTP